MIRTSLCIRGKLLIFSAVRNFKLVLVMQSGSLCWFQLEGSETKLFEFSTKHMWLLIYCSVSKRVIFPPSWQCAVLWNAWRNLHVFTGQTEQEAEASVVSQPPAAGGALLWGEQSRWEHLKSLNVFFWGGLKFSIHTTDFHHL